MEVNRSSVYRKQGCDLFDPTHGESPENLNIMEIIDRNSDQGSHFTNQAYLDLMESSGVRISMNGKCQALDNVRIERFFRSLQYEEDIYINEYITPREMIAGVNRYILDYNTIPPHESLGGLAPDAFARQQKTNVA